MKKLLCVILFGAGSFWRSLGYPKPTANCETKGQGLSRPEDAMKARIIEFYVPARFQRKETPNPQSQRGKVIEFCAGGREIRVAPSGRRLASWFPDLTSSWQSR
jgi:hypothetical protein